MASYWSKEDASNLPGLPRKRKEAEDVRTEQAERRSKVLKCTHTFGLSHEGETKSSGVSRGTIFTTNIERMMPSDVDVVSRQIFEVKEPSFCTGTESSSSDSRLRTQEIASSTEGSSLEKYNPGSSTDTEGILELAAGDVCTSTFDESTPWGIELVLETKWIRMKRAAMVEFESKIKKLKEDFKTDKESMADKYLRDIANLEEQTNMFRELVYQKEKVATEKTIVISNLTRALQQQQDQMLMSKAFFFWRMQYLYHKREQFVLNSIAEKHYIRIIKQKAFLAWYVLTKNFWRAKVQQFYETRSNEYCQDFALKADADVKKLNKELSKAHKEIENLTDKMNTQKYEMKRSLLRGVSALNAETMKLFASTDFSANSGNMTCSHDVQQNDQQTTGKSVPPIPAPRRSIPTNKEREIKTKPTSSQENNENSLPTAGNKTVVSRSSKRTEASVVERHRLYKHQSSRSPGTPSKRRHVMPRHMYQAP